MNNQREEAAKEAVERKGDTGEYVRRILELMMGHSLEIGTPTWKETMQALLDEAGPLATSIAISSYNKVVYKHACKCKKL